jgi:hypothetical protein
MPSPSDTPAEPGCRMQPLGYRTPALRPQMANPHPRFKQPQAAAGQPGPLFRIEVFDALIRQEHA